MQCDVTHSIICISNKVEYLDKEHSYKNSTKEVIYILISSDLCNEIKKILDEISYHRHFKIIEKKMAAFTLASV